MFDFDDFLNTITVQMDAFLSADFEGVSADTEDHYDNLIDEYEPYADDDEYIGY